VNIGHARETAGDNDSQTTATKQDKNNLRAKRPDSRAANPASARI
jgi:hypothetical protein